MKNLSILEELKLLLEAGENANDDLPEEDVAADVASDAQPEPESSNSTSPLLKLDVNPNPTKKGIKVQFVLPKGYTVTKKEELTQKLKTKLNAGLAQHMMSVDVDLDVPYENVIGFLIRLSNIKMLIKSILEGGTQAPNQSDNLPVDNI
jgi:hypothetical protein